MLQEKSYYLDRAQQLRLCNHNCAQAVACAFAQEMCMHESGLYALAEGFGGGMGGKEGTCGALSGAIMVISSLLSSGDPSVVTKQATYEKTALTFSTFADQVGSTICKEILGVDSGTPLVDCDACIATGVSIVLQVLTDHTT